ncbi:MAG: hypothetical protein JXR48_14910 [Candidatus Delongbacteria bacterium]|nr:hypothetical protein [Candidatus Delongbacteria bacterium]MBN2836247.1 hypothetical protein [Candidatus Delongbacteria bacterium]
MKFRFLAILFLCLGMLFAFDKQKFYAHGKKFISSKCGSDWSTTTDEELKQQYEAMKAQMGGMGMEAEEEEEDDAILVSGMNPNNMMDSIQLIVMEQIGDDVDSEMEGLEKIAVNGKEGFAGQISESGLTMGVVFVKINDNKSVVGIIKANTPNTKDDMVKLVKDLDIKKVEDMF